MKNYTHITRKKLIIFLITLLLLAGSVIWIYVHRPIHDYTIYRVEYNQTKEKVAQSKSFDRAQKQMVNYAVPAKKTNAYIEDDQGRRIAIAYGIVNMKPGADSTVEYYCEYKDRMQNIDADYGADALYEGTLQYNGEMQVLFQQASAVGQVPLKDVELLNIFDSSEVASFSMYEVNDGILYHNITTDVKKAGHDFKINLGPSSSRLKNGLYYSWDGGHYYSDLITLIDDKIYKTDSSKNTLKKYASHTTPFNYTALLQDTNYTVKELNTYIKNYVESQSPLVNTGDLFFQAQKQYDVNALALFAMVSLEIDSDIKLPELKNHIFHLAEAVSTGFLDKDSEKYAGDFFGNKAVGMNVFYTGDPYWGEKAASIYMQADLSMGAKDSLLLLSTDKEQ